MSTYTIRIIEGYLPCLSGSYYDVSDISESLPVGSYVKVYDKGNKYYQITENGLKEVSDVPYAWMHLNLYSERQYIEPLGYWTDNSGVKHYYDNNSDNCKIYSEENGHQVILEKNEYFCNNGGVIRDDYVRSLNDTPITNRGLPKDISKSAYNVLLDKDGKRCGYDYTYTTLNGLYNLYDEVQSNLVRKITEKIQRDNIATIHKKLDFIMDNMKDPMSIKIADITALKKTSDSENDDEYYDYDSLDYLIEEGFNTLMTLAVEIGKVKIYADVYDISSDDNIRVIYYLD